jgi:hypothetical protein
LPIYLQRYQDAASHLPVHRVPHHGLQKEAYRQAGSMTIAWVLCRCI